MKMKVTILSIVLVTGALLAQSDGGYVPSDPARVGATGQPQLVECYHPL
ncbi:MAG: hypothetical protein Q8O42_06580 [Acidobacteriota bacterium]|nr:hypothetical protein [Acidobacteriota bacterium]